MELAKGKARALARQPLQVRVAHGAEVLALAARSRLGLVDQARAEDVGVAEAVGAIGVVVVRVEPAPPCGTRGHAPRSTHPALIGLPVLDREVEAVALGR